MALPYIKTLPPTGITISMAGIAGEVMERGALPCYGWLEVAPLPAGLGSKTARALIPSDDYTLEATMDLHPWQQQQQCRIMAQNPDGVSAGRWIKFWPQSATKPDQGAPWLIWGTEERWVGYTLTWRCWTDIPCHLKIRWGQRNPWKKRGTHYKRGTVFRHSPIVFFPYIGEIEQSEAKDTLEHTFLMPMFEVYPRLYWMAEGKVDGKTSPSRSAVYSARRPVPRVKSIGIYGEAEVLTGDVSLEGSILVDLRLDLPHNAIEIRDP